MSSSSTFRAVPPAADVVIIGGGVMGASIAFHLAEAGVSRIVVVERAELGSGSSGKPIGGLRAHFSDPLNIELSKRSLRAYQDFPSRPGTDIRLDRVGYLFLLTSSQQAADFETSVRLQNSLDVPSRMLTPDEAREPCPYAPPTSPSPASTPQRTASSPCVQTRTDRVFHGQVANGVPVAAA